MLNKLGIACLLFQITAGSYCVSADTTELLDKNWFFEIPTDEAEPYTVRFLPQLDGLSRYGKEVPLISKGSSTLYYDESDLFHLSETVDYGLGLQNLPNSLGFTSSGNTTGIAYTHSFTQVSSATLGTSKSNEYHTPFLIGHFRSVLQGDILRTYHIGGTNSQILAGASSIFLASDEKSETFWEISNFGKSTQISLRTGKRWFLDTIESDIIAMVTITDDGGDFSFFAEKEYSGAMISLGATHEYSEPGVRLETGVRFDILGVRSFFSYTPSIMENLLPRPSLKNSRRKSLDKYWRTAFALE